MPRSVLHWSDLAGLGFGLMTGAVLGIVALGAQSRGAWWPGIVLFGALFVAGFVLWIIGVKKRTREDQEVRERHRKLQENVEYLVKVSKGGGLREVPREGGHADQPFGVPVRFAGQGTLSFATGSGPVEVTLPYPSDDGMKTVNGPVTFTIPQVMKSMSLSMPAGTVVRSIKAQ